MVELYWPRNTTFSQSTASGPEEYQPGLHDIDEDRVERFKERGWVDPDDDDVDVEIQDQDDDDEKTLVVEEEAEDGEEEPEVELEEDELSLSPGADDGDGEGDDFDAEDFVDRTPQKEVIVDLESGEYDDRLDEIESAESGDRDRRGVERAIAERREENDSDDSE